MSIFSGSTEITTIYSGSNIVKSVYSGANLVWQYGPQLVDSLATSAAVRAPSIDLTSLDLQENDFVIIGTHAESNNTDRTFSFVTSGWTTNADLFADDSLDTNVAVFSKRMGASPDSSFSFQLDFDVGSKYNTKTVVYVVRGANTTTAIDVSATATGINSGIPNPPAVTTTVNSTLVVVIGGTQGAGTITDFTAPTGMSNLVKSGDTSQQIAFASVLRSDAGSYDPPVFGGGSSSTGSAWASMTIALKP